MNITSSLPAFTPSIPLGSVRRAQRVQCSRIAPSANINYTGDSEREDEIAAKIASLRKQKRLQSQTASSSETKTDESSSPVPDGPPNASAQRVLYDDLPDWKKEELMAGQMAEAEKFFNKGVEIDTSFSLPTPVPPPENASEAADEPYEPKVRTWGVFPRPNNISKSFGGGRNIKAGGESFDSEESKKRDEAVAKRLAAYREARGIDVKREEEHRDQIEAALADGEALIKRTKPYEAVSRLEGVQDFVSDRSRLGGRTLMTLALAYEAVGMRESARDLYVRLRHNAFPEISAKAKQLLQGFAAMESLGVEDETQSRGLRVMDFMLPDVNSRFDKRYETAVVGDRGAKRSAGKVDFKTNLLLLALIGSPALLIGALILGRGH